MPIIIGSGTSVSADGATFSGLLAEFYARGFEYLDDSAAGTTRAKRWLNQARAEINDLENWVYLRSTTTGTAPLTITDLRAIESVVTTSGPLEEIDALSLSAQVDDITATGAAAYFYRTAITTITTYPLSTETLTVAYTKVEDDLVNDGDTTLIPARFMDVIVNGAVRRALLDDTDIADRGQVAEEWAQGVNQMRATLLPVFNYQLVTEPADW